MRVSNVQRSATAIEAFMRELLRDPVHHVSDEAELVQMVHGLVRVVAWH